MARESSVSNVCEVFELRQLFRGELEGIVYAAHVRYVQCHPYIDHLPMGLMSTLYRWMRNRSTPIGIPVMHIFAVFLSAVYRLTQDSQ